MGILTGQRGLTAIARAGWFDEATYALKDGHRYPAAKRRIAETYRQLADGSMSGAALFADLQTLHFGLDSDAGAWTAHGPARDRPAAPTPPSWWRTKTTACRRRGGLRSFPRSPL